MLLELFSDNLIVATVAPEKHLRAVVIEVALQLIIGEFVFIIVNIVRNTMVIDGMPTTLVCRFLLAI